MKTVVITGAASGMGLCATKKFLNNNWQVVMADYDVKNGQTQADKLATTFNDAVLFKQTNVADAKSVSELAQFSHDKFGKIDAIINNAGVFVKGALHEVAENDWDRIMNIDVKSVYLMTKSFVPDMIKQRSGVILNTASISGLMGDFDMAAYSTAKGALTNLVKSMALDYGKYGIRVNNIAPGPTNTPMFQQNPQAVIDKFVAASPLKKIVEPEDIANMMYFLASDEASSVTGQNIGVTAGFGIYSSQPQQ